MRGQMKKIGIMVMTATIIMSLLAIIHTKENVNAQEDGENLVATETLPKDTIFTQIDEKGHVVEVSDEELQASGLIENTNRKQARSVVLNEDVILTKGVVNFRTKPSASYNTSYTEVTTGRSGYTNGYYAADAAYLGHNETRTKVKFMQAGVIGWVSADEVQVLDFSSDSVQTLSKYYVKNGRLYHGIVTNLQNSNYTSSLDVGAKPAYLSEGAEYYSYDGHYFYAYDGTKGYLTMLTDYRNDTRAHSVNPSQPYYNYFQYLPHRSQTSYTASQLNQAMTQLAVHSEKNSGRTSKMKTLGQNYIDNQNKYGINALLMIGVSGNESAWGTSQIAYNKNNLFGHAAYDSDPNGSSNAYSTPAFSIYYHASTFMSKQYCYPNNWKYNGSFLGDKASGINVKYASDPYWSEKSAAIAWSVDRTLGSKDAYKYTLGIKDVYNYQFTNASIKNNANSTSTTLYRTINTDTSDIISNYAFINLNNELTNGYYKIQSDGPLTATRSALVNQSEYSFANDYAYIGTSQVKIVSKGSESSSNNGSEETPITPTYKKGDVNGDGRVSTLDYIAIENHIMNRTKLIGDKLKRADVNGDGRVSTLDYIAIENHIMGRKLLF